MKKKGFTLIELLAVIVILAIIALIATPLVLKYIEKSRQESKVDSAYSFIRNLETEIANFSIKHNGKKYNGKMSEKGYYELSSFKDSEIDTTVKGDKPDNIKVCLSSLGQVEKATLQYGKYYVSYDGKKGSISDKDTYDNFSCIGSNIDSDPGIIVCNNVGIGEIRSIEDLVYLSTNPNVCPILKLMRDLDFNDAKSYASNEIDDSLISGEGFVPIGIKGKDFKSIFDGNKKTIKGLYINRPEEIYVGLFGSTDGAIIKNLNLINSNVTGNNIVGGLVGYNNGTIKFVSLDNINVAGTDNVGGIVGSNYLTVTDSKINGTVAGKRYCALGVGYAVMKTLVKNIIVEGNVTGDTYTGGVVGYNYSDNATGVYLSGGVTCGASCGIITGYDRRNLGYGTATGLTNANVTLNGEIAEEARGIGTKGKIISGMGTRSEYEALGFEFESTDTNEAYWYFNKNNELELIIK